MNTTMGSRQLQAFLDLAEQKGLTPDRMTGILGSGVLADVMDVGADLSNREAVRQALKLGLLLTEPIILEVDYSQDLEKMIVAGNYDYRNPDITAKRFPITGKGVRKFEAKLVHPNRNISTDDSEAQIKALDTERPWQPGKIEHLLAFGKQFPEEQRKYPIVASGSVAGVYGDRLVPFLDGDGSKRYLNLRWRGSGWRAVYRFLAVREVSPISGS